MVESLSARATWSVYVQPESMSVPPARQSRAAASELGAYLCGL